MSRPQPLALAAGLFTVVPMPPVLDLQRGDARRALAWLPVVGLLLGACAATDSGPVAGFDGSWTISKRGIVGDND